MKECYVLIYGIDGLVDDIEVFFSFEDAEKAFEEYTGIKYGDIDRDYDLLGNKYPTKIICKTIQDSDIFSKIADFIIKEVQQNSEFSISGFQYIVDYKDIYENFSVEINEYINSEITKALQDRKEVADMIEDTDGFDVVLYTDYAPNYCKKNFE